MALNQTRQIIRRDCGGESRSMQLKQPPCLILLWAQVSESAFIFEAHTQKALRSAQKIQDVVCR